MGYWLHRDPCGCGISGLAPVLEFHYTTTLQDADQASFFGGNLVFGSRTANFDIVNMTVGLHVEIAGNTNFHVGGVFPLGDQLQDRFFDSEFLIRLNRQF